MHESILLARIDFREFPLDDALRAELRLNAAAFEQTASIAASLGNFKASGPDIRSTVDGIVSEEGTHWGREETDALLLLYLGEVFHVEDVATRNSQVTSLFCRSFRTFVWSLLWVRVADADSVAGQLVPLWPHLLELVRVLAGLFTLDLPSAHALLCGALRDWLASDSCRFELARSEPTKALEQTYREVELLLNRLATTE